MPKDFSKGIYTKKEPDDFWSLKRKLKKMK